MMMIMMKAFILRHRLTHTLSKPRICAWQHIPKFVCVNSIYAGKLRLTARVKKCAAQQCQTKSDQQCLQ